MNMLSVSVSGNYLEKNGKPFFYLADTCWSAFTNISDTEWVYYLEKRRAQGFNVVQINILPQWDASPTLLEHDPFERIDGVWDYSRMKEEYFEHAASMCAMAKAYGFELALVVLWCNYVPDTWASRFYKMGIMPKDAIAAYIDKVNETFSCFDPVYVISGDTDFNTPLCESYYIEAFDRLKELAPDCLFTTHIKGRYTYIPERLADGLDLLFYQSGHNHNDLAMPYKLALEMREKYPGKPIINSEPCYEEMGFSGGRSGRWHRADIVRAAWESVLSGASAGIAYGAAGIYSWHIAGTMFGSSIGEGFAAPKPWQDALNFEGAWDYGFLAYWIGLYQLYDLVPDPGFLAREYEGVRVAKCARGHVLYVPYNVPLKTTLALKGVRATILDLERRYVSVMEIPDETDTLPIHPFHRDVVVLLEKA